MVKVLIGMGVPNSGLMYSKTFVNLLSIKKPENFSFFFVRGAYVDFQRNSIVKEMLADKENTHVFFVDSDTVMPDDALMKLLALDKEIVSGLYFHRSPPHHPHLYKLIDGRFEQLSDYEKDSLIEVDGTGAGCLLIKREVFEKLSDKVENVNNVLRFFNITPQMGEDLFFSKLAKENGFKIFCDTNIKCGHIELGVVGEQNFLYFKK